MHGWDIPGADPFSYHTPYGLTKLEHDEYEEKWNGFCDAYFAQGDE